MVPIHYASGIKPCNLWILIHDIHHVIILKTLKVNRGEETRVDSTQMNHGETFIIDRGAKRSTWKAIDPIWERCKTTMTPSPFPSLDHFNTEANTYTRRFESKSFDLISARMIFSLDHDPLLPCNNYHFFLRFLVPYIAQASGRRRCSCRLIHGYKYPFSPGQAWIWPSRIAVHVGSILIHGLNSSHVLRFLRRRRFPASRKVTASRERNELSFTIRKYAKVTIIWNENEVLPWVLRFDKFRSKPRNENKDKPR